MTSMKSFKFHYLNEDHPNLLIPISDGLWFKTKNIQSYSSLSWTIPQSFWPQLDRSNCYMLDL